MAVGIQDICYIDTVTPPVATYAVAHGSWDHTPQVMVATERSVTGKLHIHRVVDGGGDPYLLEEDKFTLIATLAQMVTLRALVGQTVYYVPNYHDPLALAGYITTAVFMIPAGGMTNIDPHSSYWRIKCQFMDESTVP